MKKIRREPPKKLVTEQLSWHAQSKIDSHNEEVAENIHRQPKSQV